MSDINQDLKNENIEVKEVKEEIKPEVKDEVKEEVKPEVKEVVKEEVKPEVKEEIKPEVKEEIKPEVREEIKPEVKEVKEDVKVVITPTPLSSEPVQSRDPAVSTTSTTNTVQSTVSTFSAEHALVKDSRLITLPEHRVFHCNTKFWDSIKQSVSGDFGKTQKISLTKNLSYLSIPYHKDCNVYVYDKVIDEWTIGKVVEFYHGEKELLMYRIYTNNKVVEVDHRYVAPSIIIDTTNADLKEDKPTISTYYSQSSNTSKAKADQQEVIAHTDIPKGSYPYRGFTPIAYHGIKADGSAWISGFYTTPPDVEALKKEYYSNPFANVEYSALSPDSAVVYFAAGNLNNFLEDMQIWTGSPFSKLVPLHQRIFVPYIESQSEDGSKAKISYKHGEVFAYKPNDDKFIVHYMSEAKNVYHALAKPLASTSSLTAVRDNGIFQTVEVLRYIDDGYEQVDVKFLEKELTDAPELRHVTVERRIYANQLQFARGAFADIKASLPVVKVRLSHGVCNIQ